MLQGTPVLARFFRSLRSRRVPFLGTAGLLLLSLLHACTLGPPAGAPDLSSYHAFLIEEEAPVLEAVGAVSFSYKGQTESGELSVRTVRGGGTWIQLKARITGSLALEVRFDAERILVVDYVNKSYIDGENSAARRIELMGIDLTPEEFRMVLTGRVPRRNFERGGGTLVSAHQASFRRGVDRYVFTLGEDGLPTSWVKQRSGELQFRVEYRGYLDVRGKDGATVRLPERARVYVDGGKPLIILGVREYSAPAQVPEMTFALPSEAAAFTRE